MNKQSYESLIEQEIQNAIKRLLPHGTSTTITETRLRAALDTLATRIASRTRSYELLNLRTSDDLAVDWNMSRRGVQNYIASLHERWGAGRKIGRDWMLSAAETEQYADRPKPGRPKGK